MPRGGRKRKMASERLPFALPVAPLLRPAAFRVSRGDDRVGFPDGARLVSSPFQPFIGDLRPELLQGDGGRLVRMSFGVVRRPGHFARGWWPRAVHPPRASIFRQEWAVSQSCASPRVRQPDHCLVLAGPPKDSPHDPERSAHACDRRHSELDLPSRSRFHKK